MQQTNSMHVLLSSDHVKGWYILLAHSHSHSHSHASTHHDTYTPTHKHTTTHNNTLPLPIQLPYGPF